MIHRHEINTKEVTSGQIVPKQKRMEKLNVTSRELTRAERAAIRKLVKCWCANYDREYGCLILDGPCYMLGKCWSGEPIANILRKHCCRLI